MYGYQVGRDRGGMDWEIGIGVPALLCMKWITKENLLDNIGNSTQYSVVTNGKEIQEKGDMCIHMADSLCCTAETDTTF